MSIIHCPRRDSPKRHLSPLKPNRYKTSRFRGTSQSPQQIDLRLQSRYATKMSASQPDHQHGNGCGHTAIQHGDHVDYLKDGHLEHQNEDGTIEEHVLAIDDAHPGGCCNHTTHKDGHVHGPGCGHEAIQHGDHIDYIVDGRLHHPHGDHCDDHGPVEIVK